MGRAIRVTVVALHALIVALALVVPAYALFDAASALGGWTRGARDTAVRETAVVDFARWSVLLGNTAAVCGVAVATAWVVGGIGAFLTARTDVPGRGALTGAALLGACVPVYVSAVFLFSCFSVTRFSGSRSVCGLLCGLVYTPLAMLVLRAALRGVDPELEEQALLDARPRRVVWHVTLPQAAWGFAAVALLVAVLVGTDFTMPDILMVRTFADECYTQYQLDQRRAGPLLTALPVLLVLVAAIGGWLARYRLGGEGSLWHLASRPRVYALGRWRASMGVLCAVVGVTAAGAPLLALAARLRPFGGLTTAAWDLRGELSRTVLLAACAATLVVLPAVGLAWTGLRDRRWAWLVWVGVIVLLALPAPVVGISLAGLLDRPGVWGTLYDSPAIVVFAYVVRFLPIGILLLVPGVQRIPRELEWAAQLDGCDGPRLHWHVTWPVVRPDAAIAWLVVVILGFGEIAASALVVPPGWETAAVRAFTLLHFGVYRDLALLALLSVGCTLLPWGVLLWLLQRTKPKL